MNTAKTCLFGGTLVAAGLTASAQTLTVNGTIQATQSSLFDGSYNNSGGGFPTEYNVSTFGDGGLTVDTINFTVASDSQVQIDALSSFAFDNWFDTYFRLYANDGNPLSAANLVANSDDWSVGTDLNGSLSNLDSFIDTFLTAGDYTLAVGAFALSDAEAAAGFSDGTLYGPFGGPVEVTFGDYRVDFYGDVVPAPASAALLGVAGLAAMRRRR